MVVAGIAGNEGYSPSPRDCARFVLPRRGAVDLAAARGVIARFVAARFAAARFAAARFVAAPFAAPPFVTARFVAARGA